MGARVALLTAVFAAACGGMPGGAWPPHLRPLRIDREPSRELTAPPALRAENGELRAVPLVWQPVLSGPVGGYVVERAGPDGEAFERIGVVRGRFATTFVDRDTALADGSAYRYRVRSMASDGGLGLPVSPLATGTTAAPPDPPPDLEAFSHLPRRVAIQWRPSPDPAVVGYVVQRSPAADGPFLHIARLSGRFSTTYIDEALGALRVFYYRVAARNAAGGEGGPGPTVQAVTKAQPLPPIGLHVTAKRLGANGLAWKPNVEEDVAGYRLLRQREGASGSETVATLPADAVEAEDGDVGAGETLTYRLVAFDADGLESAPSDPVRMSGEDYDLVARPTKGGIALRWKPRAGEGFTAARVYRLGRLRRRELARVAEDRFVDADVESGRTYRYAVVLERDDGTRAPPSAVVESSPSDR
jgi:fibronectin type 3 domain-containing protein